MDFFVKNGDEHIIIEGHSKRLTDDVVDQLVHRRKKLKMTQQDIADATGIKRANIARIELKKNEASLDSLSRIAGSMGMELKLSLEEVRYKAVDMGDVAARRVAEKSNYAQKKLPLPIGVSDYKRASIEYCYVDKTLMIRDFLDVRSQVSLFTRPRRFGKTLNMDMLRVFFEKTDEDTSVYFRDKKIWQCGEEYLQHQGKYPVIFLTFKDVKLCTWEDAFAKLRELFAEEAERHIELRDSDKCSEKDKKYFKKILSSELSFVELADAFKVLSRMLHMHHGIAPIIIVDEYDIPIQQGYTYGFYDDAVIFIRNLFSGGFKDNSHLTYGFMTGILRVAKESIFSGLNNIRVYSVLDNAFGQYFGFTHDDINYLMNYYEEQEKYEEVCNWYDGYRFGETDIFNPWSVINYFQSDCVPHAYWMSTSSNDIIAEILKQATPKVSKDLENLMAGKKIIAEIDTSVIYPKIQSSPASIYSFLVVTGYLKAIRCDVPYEEGEIYEVSIPNREISFVYKKEILSQIEETIAPTVVSSVQSAIRQADTKVLKDSIGEFLLRTISYYDTADETFYHGLMLGLCAMMENHYTITSNRESGIGRYDIQLMPKRKELPGVLIELKEQKHAPKDSLTELSQEALHQIKEKKYDTEMQAKGVQTIYKYGVAFAGKNVEVVSEV